MLSFSAFNWFGLRKVPLLSLKANDAVGTENGLKCPKGLSIRPLDDPSQNVNPERPALAVVPLEIQIGKKQPIVIAVTVHARGQLCACPGIEMHFLTARGHEIRAGIWPLPTTDNERARQTIELEHLTR